MVREMEASEYSAIGRVAVAAARLEAVVERFLSDAITPDLQVGILTVAGIPFERKVDLLKRVLHTRLPDSEDVIALGPYLTRATDLMNTRNEFLHGLWQLDQSANLTVAKRVRKTGALHARQVGVHELTSTAEEIDSLAELIENEYLDLLVDMGAYVVSAPGVLIRPRPHRPHGFIQIDTGATALIVDFSNVDDPHDENLAPHAEQPPTDP